MKKSAQEETPVAVPPVAEAEPKLEPEPEKVEVKEEKKNDDYLLKFQYGREMPLGDPRSNPQAGSKADTMKKRLLLQDRVKILIPVESGTDPSVKQSVNLNGYRLDLPKNTYIEIPQQIAEVIMNSQKQQIEALQPFRTDRKKEVEDALA